jgi:molybdate transport system substrate-binding protein
MALSRPAALVAAVVPLIALAACGGDDGATDGTAISGKVVVLAASSLTETFTELGKAFEARHPGATVTFSFAASSELATQIQQGAPADVFASASPTTMALVSDSGDTADDPVTFVRNTLEIAVPAGNPAGVTGLADFAKEDLIIALCAPEVPCGAAADKVFAATKVTPAPDTLEADVQAALAKVSLGEVDAALVYKTDVLAAGGKVDGIDFPEASGAVNDYPIAVLADAPNTEAGQAFVDLVQSAAGRKVLAEAGFQLP